MNQFKSIFLVCAMAGTVLSSVATAQESTATLAITFSGIETREGAVLGVIFDSEAAYSGKGAPVRTIMVAADSAEVSAQLTGLKPGRYAIKLFHDIDGDGKMGTNPFGLPIEPYAFSNNAIGNMGPATWAQASFEVTGGDNRHAIEIK